MYSGWGGEDDDAFIRCEYTFGGVFREKPEVGRYFANCHKRETENPERIAHLQNSLTRIKSEGLSSTRYSVTKIFKNKIFIIISVDY